MSGDRFTCEMCGDTMHVKFEPTHWKWCLLASHLIAPRVDGAIDMIFP